MGKSSEKDHTIIQISKADECGQYYLQCTCVSSCSYYSFLHAEFSDSENRESLEKETHRK